MIKSNSFYDEEELNKIRFKKIGKNCLISKNASFYTPEHISIGDNVRIDDFAILSGIINLGSYIHISAYCAIYGKFGVELQDFSGLSPKTIIFSASDDFGGDFLISPMVPKKFTNITGGRVIVKKYAQIGASSIIMPNVVIEEGVTVGAMSLVKSNLNPWTIYAGIPVRKIKTRKKGLLKNIKKLL